MAEADAEVERLELEIEGYNKEIADAGLDERLARDRVESHRKGFQEVNVEIQRCRAALEDLTGNDPTEEIQREINKKEEEATKILATYAPLMIEIKRLKKLQEESERELYTVEGDLTAARAKKDSLPNLDLMKGEIESKRKQMKQQNYTKTILEREVKETKRNRDEKLKNAEQFKKEAREKANGEEIGEVRETERELNAKRAKVAHERKKIIEEIGGLTFEEFQAKFRKLQDENAKLKYDVETCSRHVERMDKGLKFRSLVFVEIRYIHERLICRTFNKLMSLYRLFGELKFDHDPHRPRLDVEIAHMDADRQKVGDSMPLSNFSGGERSRDGFIMSQVRQF